MQYYNWRQGFIFRPAAVPGAECFSIFPWDVEDECLRQFLFLQYYNWRQDSYSDLQLFLALNAGLVLLGVAIKHNIIDNLDAGNPEKRSIWQDLYKACIPHLCPQDCPIADAGCEV